MKQLKKRKLIGVKRCFVGFIYYFLSSRFRFFFFFFIFVKMVYSPAVRVAGYCFVFDRGFGQAFTEARRRVKTPGVVERRWRDTHRREAQRISCKAHLRVMAGQTDLAFKAKKLFITLFSFFPCTKLVLNEWVV